MERLTMWYDGNQAICENENCDSDCCPFADPVCWRVQEIIDRLTAIEDILGDNYDLDRLKVLANQRMTMREEVAERFSITKDVSVDRLLEIVEAERDGRCVVLPVKIGTHVWSTVFCRLSDDGKEHPTFPWEFSVSMMDEWGTGWHLTEKDAEEALKGETNENSM